MKNKKQTIRIIDAPMYRYWQALYMAFYSSRLYVDVAKRWRGYGVLYLLLVLVIALIPLSARIIFEFDRYFNEQMILPLEALPPLYVQNGEVAFDKPMPYLIKNKTGDIVAIIDTTGAVKKINSTYPKLNFLITKDTLYFRPPKSQIFALNTTPTSGDDVYAQPLGKGSNEVFVAKDWVRSSGLLNLKLMTEILVYPVMTMFVFGLYTIFMLTLAFIGQLFALIVFKFPITFKDACRLFLVASTAQVFVFFVLLAANVVFAGIGILYVALIAVYFNYAVFSVKRESKKMVFA